MAELRIKERDSDIMRPAVFNSESLVNLLRQRKIATMPELMAALGSDAERTVFRKLRELAYRSSYSHRGSYYTLDEIARFDAVGLWSCRSVWFSMDGTLLSTSTRFVGESESGFFASELDELLHVGTRDALRKLVDDGKLARERVAGQYWYGSADPEKRRLQLFARHAQSEGGVAGELPHVDLVSDELKAALVLFLSLLDEKQRRLYAGLESLKVGHGGIGRVAHLLGLDVGTVARGRQELLQHDVELERVRREGGGRPSLEKKRQK
jgi:hypothetical protein